MAAHVRVPFGVGSALPAAGRNRATGAHRHSMRAARSAAQLRRLERVAFEQLNRGRLEQFAAAMRAGVDPDSTALTPFGLLHYVIAGQRRGGLPGVDTPAAVATLLQLGCDPTGRGDAAGLPLYLAAQLKQWAVCELLLDAKADPDRLPPQVRASLSALVMRADDPMPMLAILARGGANFDAGAHAGVLTGPEAAVGIGHAQALDLMLAHGADPNHCNGLGESLGHLAIAHPQVLRVLAARGADLGCRDPSGFTPLMMTCRAPVPIESMQVLIEVGVDVNARNNGGETALHVNAWGIGDVERVRTLAAAGIGLDVRDHRGSTAVMLAAIAQRADLFDALTQAGADPGDVTDPARAVAHIQRFLKPAPDRGTVDPGCRFAAFALERMDLRSADEAVRAQLVRALAEADLQRELAYVVQQGTPR